MPEYVVAKADPSRGWPVHVVREFGEGMRVITECGRHLFWPDFVDRPSDPAFCLTCLKRIG